MMGYKTNLCAVMLILCSVVLLLGCGPMEGEPREGVVAFSGADELDAEEGVDEAEMGKVDTGAMPDGEVTDEVDGSETEGSAAEGVVDEEADEYGTTRLCGELCFKASWCDGEEAVPFAVCMEECPGVLDSGLLGGFARTCIEEAATCTELSRCQEQVEICTELCGYLDYCGGPFVEGAGCAASCVSSIWRGDLGWSEFQCMESAGAGGDCDGLRSCGVTFDVEDPE